MMTLTVEFSCSPVTLPTAIKTHFLYSKEGHQLVKKAESIRKRETRTKEVAICMLKHGLNFRDRF